MDKKCTNGWSEKHKSMLKPRAANGLFPPAVYGKDDETRQCEMCNVPCTQMHRDLVCPARYWERRQFGLPQRILDEALRCGSDPVWSRCIVPDPTLAFPPPSVSPLLWTIAECVGTPIFSGDGYGDGSRIMLCGLGTARAAFAIIQLGGSPRQPHVVNCAMSPLIYPHPRHPSSGVGCDGDICEKILGRSHSHI